MHVRFLVRSAVVVAALTSALAGCSCENGSWKPGTDPSTQDAGPAGRRDGSLLARDGTTVPNDRGLPPGTCAQVDVDTFPVTPTVILIIDQSSSMTEAFDTGDRWTVLRNALLDQNGLVRQLEDQVRFGVALYSGTPQTCPALVQVAPSLTNFEPIRQMYAAQDPVRETPTGDSIDAIRNQLLNTPDPEMGPVIFVVATDGEPDTCEVPNPQTGQAEAIGSVERSFQAGIRTFMIWVGEANQSARNHMQDMANAGLGLAAGAASAEYWVAGDDQGLRSALQAIVGGQVSCSFTLQGRIDPGQACVGGVVRMSGRAQPLVCGTDWRAVDETHIELIGATCDAYLAADGASIEATFSCDTIVF